MSGQDTGQGRRFRTALGVFTADPCPMSQVRVRDWFVGPDQRTVYEVVAPPRTGPRGGIARRNPTWVYVRDLSMTDSEARWRAEHGEAEDGVSPRDGVFTYSVDVVVHRIRK